MSSRVDWEMACAIHELQYTPEKILRRAMIAHGNSTWWVAKRRRRHLCQFAYVLSCEQCCGSTTFWCGPGSRSSHFHHWLSRRQQKTNFKKVFLHIIFAVTFTSFFKDKKSKRSHKTVEVKVFLTIFANWLKDPDPDPWGPKHVDPDSQHCLW
jgi:hypothetical protein